ncbi:MAG TPA: glycoside hydrolase family 75 protein [Candidatus Paceibacterota bacterium]|nr:glycoside hydrolase family 75 protein [Candidatus Paceibacterota bacterium]
MSPTPEQILAALAALPSTRVGGPYATDSGGRADIYVNKTSTGAIWWKADMDIDTDGQWFPESDNNSDRQSQTSFTQSDGKPLNSGTLPFIVIPLPSDRFRYRDHGIRGGDSCIVILNGRMVYAVFGDEGPTSIIGEASYAAAKALGVPGIPYSGWDGRDVTYIVFPGSNVRPIESAAERLAKGEANAAALIAAAGGQSTPPADPEEEEPPVTTPLSGADKMVAFAETTLGMSDQNNTVRTPVHTWYNAKFGNPDPGKYAWDWCDGWITYLAWQTGQQQAVVFGGAFAYTVDHANAFKSRGQWHVDTAGIRRGDIVFFDWDGSNNISAIDHVGLCVGVNADGTVQTIEGNIENAVRRKTRSSATIVGYGRPNYTGGTTPPPDNGGGNVATVKLADAIAKTPAATRVIQDALNREFGGVVVDGDYGPQTAAAYTRWQQSLGWPGDGVPGAHSLWSLAKKYGFSTDITGTPQGPGGTTPTPDPEPEVPAVSIYFEEVGARGTVAANKVVQTALNKWKSSPALLVDGDFGPKTSARYKEWQVSLYGAGPDADGIPGVSSLTELGKRSAYPFTVKRKTTTTPPPVTNPPATGTPSVADYLTQPEPAHNYSRVTYGGRTVNVRTREMLKLAAAWAGVSISLTQGSYNTGVAASAGTHDGGGVVDINVNSWSSATRSKVVLALRKAGFAAWLRTPAQGFSYHIHACAIGDREMASGARNQVQSYFNGRNGLANNGADDAERRWPNWADKYNQ